jgi:hypothetical protein
MNMKTKSTAHWLMCGTTVVSNLRGSIDSASLVASISSPSSSFRSFGRVIKL